MLSMFKVHFEYILYNNKLINLALCFLTLNKNSSAGLYPAGI